MCTTDCSKTIVDPIVEDDRKSISTELEGNPVNETLLNCINRTKDNKLQKFKWNACVASCMSELLPKGEAGQQNNRMLQESKDERGIDRLVSVIVKKNRKGENWRIVSEKKLNDHLNSIKLKDRHREFVTRCKDCTQDRVDLGKCHTFKRLKNLLMDWIGVLEWISGGLQSSKASLAFEKEGCSIDDINELAGKASQDINDMAKDASQDDTMNSCIQEFLREIPDRKNNKKGKNIKDCSEKAFKNH